MRNVYIIIQNGIGDVNLTTALIKGRQDGLPHQKVHSAKKGSNSILNGEFSNEDIAFFEDQSWAYVIGNYLPTGQAEQKVYNHGTTFSKPAYFIKNESGQFMRGYTRFRNVGVNKYNLLDMSQTNVQAFFDACQARKIKVVRTWCFDKGKPPTDNALNFRYLDYPLGDNLVTNSTLENNDANWTLDTGFTRDNTIAHGGTWSIKQQTNGGFNVARTAAFAVLQNTNYVWTLWYAMNHISGFEPVARIRNGDTGTQIKDCGFVGTGDQSLTWKRKQFFFNSGSATSVTVEIQSWGGNVVAYYDDIHVGVQQTPTLTAREATFTNLDMVLDEARQRNVKLILSLADNNPNFDTKKTYVDWVNTLYGAGLSTAYPYIGFFESTHCKNLYKAFVDLLVNRVNTINGRTYKNDDTIFSWELGNELRVDRFTSESGTQNTINSLNIALLSKSGGWIDEMSTYIKSKDPNHMVAPPSGSHMWKWVNGDSVANGSGYGIDYELIAKLPNIDYITCHFYPTQGGGEVQVTKKYGQHLGFPNTINTAGLEAQIKHYISTAKANGKPFIMGEVGFIREVIGSNTIIPLYPRVNTATYMHDLVFDNDGDGVGWWHGEVNDGGSYSINITSTWNGNTTNLNFDDRLLASEIEQRNATISS